jgi:hypothetical protein
MQKNSQSGVEVVRILDVAAMIEHYISDAITFWCSDLRFQGQRKALELRRSLSNPDPLILPGGLRHIFAPEKEYDREFVVRMLIKLINAHGAREVHAQGHIQCANCADLVVHCASLEEEFEFFRCELMPRGVSFLQQDLDAAYKERLIPHEVRVIGQLGEFAGLHEMGISQAAADAA